MAKLLIGFLNVKDAPSISHRLMSWGLNHDIIHCELFFDEYLPNQRFASWNGSGVGFRSVGDLNSDFSKWIFYDLGSQHYNEALFVAQQLTGKGYDLKTAMLASAGVRNEDDENFYCSEICYHVMKKAGYQLPQMSEYLVLPHEMEEMVNHYPRVYFNY